MSPILLAGGRVIDPARGLDATADVLLAEGRVAEISTAPRSLVAPPDAIRLDAEGCIVCPGLIDIHVHFRDPGEDHEETIATGSASAAAGGFTTVCCMPNTRPPLDRPELIEQVVRRGRSPGGARVLPVAAATRGRRGEAPSDMAALAAAGAVAFSDDGDCVASAGVMREVLRSVHAAGSCFMQHCEDPTLTRGAALHEGPVAARLGLPGWPRVAEEIVIERDIRLNREIQARYHAQHLSSGGSADLIAAARAAGQPVTAEATPHHLLLTDEACAGGDTSFKMNPPLRARKDVERLRAAVADGTITILATDHAPHPPSRKAVPFAEAAFGIVGLDCALPLYARALVESGALGWPDLVALMTVNPARLLGFDRMGLGSLAPGGPADVTVIDPDLGWTIDAGGFASTGRNCPFHGWQVRGRAIATILGGRPICLRDLHRVSRPG